MSNPSRFTYISKELYRDVLCDLNIDTETEGGLDDRAMKDLLDRAVGDLESDLVKRFVVPLVATNGSAFDNAPYYARQKILNALKAKIRELIGQDKMKNITIDSSERYIDIKKMNYNSHIKVLLDHERVFGFRLQSYSQDGALNPVQQVGVARPDNARMNELEDEDLIY